MKIIVDALGGDNAPLEILKGCQMAVKELNVEIALAGDEEKIKKCAEENGISLNKMELIGGGDEMDMHAEPATILKENSGTSMAAGLKALSEGKGDAFVSAGSTGALAVGATFIVKRLKGVKRPCIGSVMPSSDKPFMLLDCGANAECRPEMLRCFGVMGSTYMKQVMKMESPRVALANIGTEPEKGGELQKAAYALLKEEKNCNFIGNIEARDIPFGKADVVVADGFTGNMLLKMYEGTALALMKNIKGIFMKSIITKLSALMLKSGLSDFKKKMDYTEYGGAALLGVRKPVIKAHGSSNAKAFKNAIRQAVLFAETGVNEKITEAMEAEAEKAAL